MRARSVKSGKAAVLLVTDGLEEELTGTLVYCVKSDANKELKMRNIGDVCSILEHMNNYLVVFRCNAILLPIIIFNILYIKIRSLAW